MPPVQEWWSGHFWIEPLDVGRSTLDVPFPDEPSPPPRSEFALPFPPLRPRPVLPRSSPERQLLGGRESGVQHLRRGNFPLRNRACLRGAAHSGARTFRSEAVRETGGTATARVARGLEIE